MEQTVTLPFWQFIILVLLGFYALMQLVVLPLTQKYIYQRFQAAEKSLDEELDFGLPSFALANRRLWIDRLVNDQKVIEAIQTAASEGNLPLNEVIAQAKKYADEIVPSFNAVFYFRFGYWLAKYFLRIFYWIKVGHSSQRDYDQISKDCCVVLVSNHRSNFDPLLLIYMTSRRAPISYSAGEWALIFPFKQLLHTIGFYIVRRDRSGDKLYHCLLKRYVYMATSHCVPQGVFIEGSLSRDGHMQPLKLGLLNYLVQAYNQENCKDIVFIPAAINYDKIPEDKTLILHQQKGFEDKGKVYSLLSFLRFFATVITYMMPRRHKPFGYACVNFGTPISFRKWQQENDIAIETQNKSAQYDSINKLGHELADKIKKLIPVLPTHIIAKVFNNNALQPLSEIEIKVKASELIRLLTEKGVPVVLPNNDEDYALSQGIYVFIRRKIICPTGDGRFKLVAENLKLLEYYCNSVSGHSISDL